MFGPSTTIIKFHIAPNQNNSLPHPVCFGKNQKFSLFRLFWKVFQEITTICISVRKSQWKTHMLRDAKTDSVVELKWIVFIAHNKQISFDFSTMNSKDYFLHHSEIQSRFQLNIIRLRSQTARGILKGLTDWPRGIMDRPLAAFLFVPPWVALQRWNLPFWRTKCFSTGIEIVIDCLSSFFLSAWQLLGISSQTGYSPFFSILLPAHWLYLQSKVISAGPDVLPTCSSKITILGRKVVTL